MEQLDIDTLSDIDLAVAVAHNVMDWDTASRSDADNPMMQVYHDGKWHEWQPWRDMRAAWEIVEKMVADGWLIDLGSPISSQYEWSVTFGKDWDYDGLSGHEGGGKHPGIAIMRAALAAVRSAK